MVLDTMNTILEKDTALSVAVAPEQRGSRAAERVLKMTFRVKMSGVKSDEETCTRNEQGGFKTSVSNATGSSNLLFGYQSH